MSCSTSVRAGHPGEAPAWSGCGSYLADRATVYDLQPMTPARLACGRIAALSHAAAATTMTADEVTQLIETGLPGAQVRVATDDDTHFDGGHRRRAVRRQAVRSSVISRSTPALGARMGRKIHALSIQAYTPAEWQAGLAATRTALTGARRVDKLQIRGGVPLDGEVRISGAKNADAADPGRRAARRRAGHDRQRPAPERRHDDDRAARPHGRERHGRRAHAHRGRPDARPRATFAPYELVKTMRAVDPRARPAGRAPRPRGRFAAGRLRDRRAPGQHPRRRAAGHGRRRAHRERLHQGARGAAARARASCSRPSRSPAPRT